ncbi:MAG: hypothetical protein M3020_00795 [Myxococcota bacterium]|jgi:hypothetical protein|nr:hypothetical protein [Myxococcota bacterium]
MSLELGLEIADPSVTTLTAPKLTLRLVNQGAASVRVPSDQDLSGALQISTWAGASEVRRASGLTHQLLMNSGRADPRVDWLELAPGEGWTRVIDLASYQYSPPAGQYQIDARLALDADTAIVSNRVSVEIRPVSLRSLACLRDNPVLDGSTFLFGCSGAGPAWVLRLYNTGRPLAGWFSEALDVPVRSRVTVARRSTFSTASFDPFFEQWLLWQDGPELSRVLLRNGSPSGAVTTALLPVGFQLLSEPAGFGQGGLEVYALDASGNVACFGFGAQDLEQRWQVGLGAQTSHGIEPRVFSDESATYVVWLDQGIVVARVERDGGRSSVSRSFGSDLEPDALSVDALTRTVLASFGARAGGPHLQAVAASLGGDPRVFYQERPRELEGVTEIGVGQTQNGQLHLLANAQEGLFYQAEAAAPLWLRAPMPERRPSIVCPQQRLHLGFFEPALGYNLYELRRGSLVEP